MAFLRFRRDIHGSAQLIKGIIGNCEFAFRKPRNRLFVLNLHSTPKRFINNFETLIEFLDDYFEIISPIEFFNMLGDSAPINRNQVLLSFDYGLRNNRFAIEILDKRNLSSILFVVPAFIGSEDPIRYYTTNIRPTIHPLIDQEEDDFVPLSWEELRSISKKHVIGCHTLTHTMTKDSVANELIDEEVVASKKLIEVNLGISVNSFCSIGNSLLTVNSQSKKIIASNYEFHFTTLAGCNNVDKRPLFIKRINVECFWTKGTVKFSLGAFGLSRWRSKIRLFNSI